MKILQITSMDVFLIIILVILEQLFICLIQEKSQSMNAISKIISASRVLFYSIKIHVKNICCIIFKIILKVNKNNSLILIDNYFYGNSASEDGAILYFLQSKGRILFKNNTFLNNSIKSGTDKMGSVIYLLNPGNITMISSSFRDNTGITGASIYYSESTGNFFYYILNFN